MQADPKLIPLLIAHVPLFAEFEPEPLSRLLSIFERQSFAAGESVFEAGAKPQHLRVLVSGVLSVRSEEGEVFEVRPPAPVGELSVLTGEARKLTVVATEPSELLAVHVEQLEAFLREHGDIAFVLHRNLLRLAAKKIARDHRRLEERRSNIITTQKAMKRMRAALLESEDNPLHAALFEELDASIEQNRRAHYLVEPSPLVPTRVRAEGGSEHPVTALSSERLCFGNPPAGLRADSEWSGTLVLDGQEMPVSGQVEHVDGDEVSVYLDELIPDYEEQLNRHLARSQLLDVVL